MRPQRMQLMQMTAFIVIVVVMLHAAWQCPERANKKSRSSYDQPPRARSVSVNSTSSEIKIDRNLNSHVVQGKNCQLLVKLSPGDRRLYAGVPDTGAQLSLINDKLAHKLKLTIIPPKREKFIKLADKSLVKRKGHVKLPITVLFQGTNRKPIVCVQQFEVFNIESDFLFGTDILPALFPNESFTQFVQPHASITSKPVMSFGLTSVSDDNNNEMNVESPHVKLSDDEVNASDVFVTAVHSYDLTDDEPEPQAPNIKSNKN